MSIINENNIIIRIWNKTLADCYLRGCVCKGCPIYERYFAKTKEKCNAKKFVIAAVRKLGVPDSLKRKNDIIGD